MDANVIINYKLLLQGVDANVIVDYKLLLQGVDATAIVDYKLLLQGVDANAIVVGGVAVGFATAVSATALLGNTIN